MSDTHAAEGGARGLHGTGAVAFSTRGEYGVRFMVALARMDHGEPVSLTDIAEANMQAAGKATGQAVSATTAAAKKSAKKSSKK